MKKFVACAAALPLAAPIGFALPSTAAADTTGTGNSGITAVCQAGLAAYLGLSQGNCINLARWYIGTSPLNANTVCHYIQSNYPVYFSNTYSSFGACVAQYNAG